MECLSIRCLPSFGNVIPAAVASNNVSYIIGIMIYLYCTLSHTHTHKHTHSLTLSLSLSHTQATARYSYEFNKVLLLYSVVISANYLTVFLSLLVCYTKILRYIQSLKREYSKF